MKAFKKLVSKFYRTRSRWRMRERLLFPSPAEVEFIRIMGGKAIVIDHVKNLHTGFPLTIVTTMGKTLKVEYVEREVRVGKYYVDFGNDLRRGIEIDGKNFHTDVVKEQERDDYCAGYGWILMHIQAVDLYRNPVEVRERVTRFLTK